MSRDVFCWILALWDPILELLLQSEGLQAPSVLSVGESRGLLEVQLLFWES